jgi:thiol-disulfide isomerase/thioredoxin
MLSRSVLGTGKPHLLLISLPLTVLLAISGCQTWPSEERAPTGVKVGQTFPSFELKNLQGQQQVLEDFLSRVTLVTFAFPTCGPCNAELPHFQEFHETYSTKGLTVVAINVIPEQDPLVEEWRVERGFGFPILVGAESGQLIEDYRLVATPLSFLLDSEGRILARYDGYRPGQEEEIEVMIRRELGAGD